MNETTNTAKTLTVLTDSDTGDECLYVNGNAWESKGEATVYATDIAKFAGGEPIRFEHHHVEMDWCDLATWPDLLDDAMTFAVPTPENDT